MGRGRRKVLLSLIILTVSLSLASVVMADYLGPNRDQLVTVWERLRCSYQGVYDPPGPGYWGCGLDLYYPPSAGCPSTGSVIGYFSPSACGWSWSCAAIGCTISGAGSGTEGCSPGDSGCEGHTQTITNPPATISGTINCADPGSNGWCRSAASINLNGSEPLSGYSITALEGTRNGETFACAGTSCSVDLFEGQNDFTFWALSTWGDSSSMGTASGKVDTQAPSLNGSLTGTLGDNGWYVSDVTVSANANDGMSGLQSLDMDVDGGGYQPYSEITLGEGMHTLLLRAVDNAGHVSQASQSFSVDTTFPMLGLNGGGSSFCPGCGDRLPLSYDAQDALSGISQWWLSADGIVVASNTAAETGIMDWDGSGLGGGTHTLTLSARDVAGNQSQASLVITLKTPPVSVPEQTHAVFVAPRNLTTDSLPQRPAAGPPLDSGLRQNKPSLVTFVSVPPEQPASSIQPVQQRDPVAPASAPTTASPVLWGGAAAGLIGAATYMALEAQRKRKEEEARQIAEMNRINAESRAREKRAALLVALAAEQRRKAEEAAFLASIAENQNKKGGSKVLATPTPLKHHFPSSVVLAANTIKPYEERDEFVDPNANWVGIKYQTMGIVTVKEVDTDFPVLTKVAANKWAWRAPVRYVRHEAVVTKTTSVDAGSDDPEVVQDFFNKLDPRIDLNTQKNIYSGCLRDGTTATVKLGTVYGEGRDVWEPYNKDQNAGQYLNLRALLKDDNYRSTVHHNLCGELAVLAALGYDLIEGLKIFAGMTFYREDAKGHPYNITGKDILNSDKTTTPNDMMRFINELLVHTNIKYNRAVYSTTKADFEKNIAESNPMIALVNLNGKTGLIDCAHKNNSDIAHFVTILDVITNPQGEKVVLIYNPYNNQQEFYNWKTFDSAWKVTYCNGMENSKYVYLKPQE